MPYIQNWACEDFDLGEFIGVDDPDFDPQFYNEGPAATTNGTSGAGTQFDPSKEDPSVDKMWATMQYNNMMVSPNDNMFGNGGGGFMQDDRYHNTSGASSTSGGSLLNSTVNKLYQQQHQQQPSTSRLSSGLQQQQPQQPTYSAATTTKMRPQLGGQPMVAQHQMNGTSADIADSVLLPTSSTSPQNAAGALYLSTQQQQPIIKCEPSGQYEMFDSTSDAESHYSHGSHGLSTSGLSAGGKPRKYRIKPESERLNPQYRMKRAKNNDAVRRSREKAKHQQLEKEKRLQFLEQEHSEAFKTINMLRQRIRELDATVQQMRKNCQCGGANQMFQR